MFEDQNQQIVTGGPGQGPNWFMGLLRQLLPPGASLIRKLLVIGVPFGAVLATTVVVAMFAVNSSDKSPTPASGKDKSTVTQNRDDNESGASGNSENNEESSNTPSSGNGGSSGGSGGGSSAGGSNGGGNSSGGSSGSSSSGGSSGSSGGGGESGGDTGDGDGEVGCALPNYPNESCTGWQHTGVTLSAYDGPSTIETDGTVIDGKDIEDCLIIDAANVTIKRSRIRCDSFWGVRMLGSNGLMEDTEINMLGFTGANCLEGTNYTGRRINCHNTGDGIRLGSNVTIEDSFVHGLVTEEESHNDGMQTTGGTNIIVRHNYIENSFSQTACIILGNESTALDNVLIENNLFNGGGYSVYGGGSDSDISNIKFINNRFKRSPAGFFANGGFYGPVSHYDATRPGNQWSGNVWHDNGAVIVP